MVESNSIYIGNDPSSTTSTADFMDQLEHMKGVKVSRGSLNLPSINTRGYATDAKEQIL